MAEAFIVEAVRTAGGRRGGRLASWHPADMAGEVLNAIVDRTGIDPAAVEDVIMGCVSQGGEQSFQVGRGAVLASKLPQSVPAVTIDRQCGSSQQAIQFAAQAVMSGTQDVVIASGVESMTRVPMGSTGMLFAQAGLGKAMSPKQAERFPDVQFSQFMGAEMIAKKYGFSREQLDQYAYESHRRAAAATERGDFRDEIVGLEVETPEGIVCHDRDEGIRWDATPKSIGAVKLLKEGGVISAANASQICDGASAVLVVSERALKEHGLTPLARIHNLTVTGGDPVIMLEEPLFATDKALKRPDSRSTRSTSMRSTRPSPPFPSPGSSTPAATRPRSTSTAAPLLWATPLGASGTKLMATLVHALHKRGGRYGLQTMCEGGGLANVTIIERV